ncbi:MAG TPA: serine hydrolase, partial [Anaerolineales bacterium]|nr:serine hydrolase [Anaerolineales bacterium]
GVSEAGTSNPVTGHTLFQAGSVSKAVTATGALVLVEQGQLQLDEDVNRRLKTWKVPENEFTKEHKVTLRQILSHSAGFTVHFFPGYAVGAPLPELEQILNGQAPANTAPVQVEFVPGTKWRYSGGGFLIAQQLMMDVTGKPFPVLMRQNVFNQIGMSQSSFEQPLSPEAAKLAASGTYWNGNVVPGKWHIYPEMAAAGLWTTPTDLAKLAIEISLSQQGRSNRILSQAIAREMLAPQSESVTEFALGNEKHPDRMGLGFFLADKTHSGLFGHIGNDAGFEAMLMMDSDTGQGVAFISNSQFGILLGDYLVRNIAKEYGWKNYILPNRPHLGADAVLIAIAQRESIPAAFRQYHRLKDSQPLHYTPDQNTLLIFGYSLLASNQIEAALEALKLEVQEYPDFWNAYDTLGEIYAAIGEQELSIENYEKSLELNPANRSAIENLKKLKG